MRQVSQNGKDHETSEETGAAIGNGHDQGIPEIEKKSVKIIYLKSKWYFMKINDLLYYGNIQTYMNIDYHKDRVISSNHV